MGSLRALEILSKLLLRRGIDCVGRMGGDWIFWRGRSWIRGVVLGGVMRVIMSFLELVGREDRWLETLVFSDIE